MHRYLAAALFLMAMGIAGPAPAQEEEKPQPEAEATPTETTTAQDGLHPLVKMETSYGDIVFELDAEKAPITVLNFVQYVEDKFYEGLIFHRVIKGFMIQAGGYDAEMNRKTENVRPPIKNEWKTGLKNEKYTIAMARSRTPDSATCQFFINVKDNSQLDVPQRDGAAYCAFGRVIEGQETVEKIRNTEVEMHAKLRTRDGAVTPVEPVIIKSVTVTGNYDKAKIEAAVAEADRKAKEAEELAKAKKAKEMDDLIKRLEEETGKTAQKTESGMAYIVLEPGDGPSPQKTDTVEVHYTGWLTDGTKFDSSVDRGTPAKFALNRVIPGWTEGVGMMSVGAKWKLIIPSKLGYGEAGRPGSIPGGATLIFDVELLSIEQ
ncbi:MAG: peptidylprolyl isomerase [Phycisphaerales bacterium]|nr:MAG: peptidylprolyl isomerase [Phycisphaerales bacterium]